MEQKCFKKFDLPFELEQLSSTQGGIYFFSVRFPTDYELGITTRVDSETVLKNLAGRLNNYARAYAYSELRGVLHDGKAEHMRTCLEISGQLEVCTKPSELLESLLAVSKPPIPLAEITRVLRFAFSADKPLYIGICFDQSFYDRISQHVNGNTGLLGFLKECQMSIVDVSVNCLPLDVADRKHLRCYEKLTQSIFRPAFSLS